MENHIRNIENLIFSHTYHLPYKNFVCGKRYKAYLNDNNKYVMCDCEFEMLSARINLYNQFKDEFTNENLTYRDQISDIYYHNLSLEEFLGLPEELKVDYSKPILEQIERESMICHRCSGFDYEWFVPVKNPNNLKSLRNRKRDARREIEKENFFIGKGVHYVPIEKMSYVIIDSLDDYAKEKLRPTLEDFDIKDKWCVGPAQFVENTDKEKQITEIKKFLDLPLDTQLKFLYRNLNKKERAKVIKKFNEKYLCLSSIYNPKVARAVFLSDIKNVDKKVRELQSEYLKELPITTSPIKEFIDLFFQQIENKWTKEEREEMIKFLDFYLTSHAPKVFYIEYDGENVNPVNDLIYKTKDKELIKRFRDIIDNFGYYSIKDKKLLAYLPKTAVEIIELVKDIKHTMAEYVKEYDLELMPLEIEKLRAEILEEKLKEIKHKNILVQDEEENINEEFDDLEFDEMNDIWDEMDEEE